MKKILRKIQGFIRGVIDFIVRLILLLAYFVILFPFAFFARVFRDFLEIETVEPFWHGRRKIEDIEDFLTKQ